MKIDSFLFFLIFVLLSFTGQSQVAPKTVSLLFYNVENLFDTEDDPGTEDGEFTPTGDRHWTYSRLNEKLLGLSKVILGASGFNPPSLIGLCEVENRFVLEMLLNETPLNALPYKIIHKDSPDTRGIDVAFIYNDELFYPLSYSYHPLQRTNGELMQSREILYVKGILNNTDTLHIFVNHWPSRYDGLLETRQSRILAANTLSELVDKLLGSNPNAKIILTGDFNDQPTDESILMLIDTLLAHNTAVTKPFHNFSASWMNKDHGTLKYQSQWFVYDQFIVSGALLNRETGVHTTAVDASIVNLPFLFEEDQRYGGQRPNRTYTGFQYHGGFSDHLPIVLKLFSTSD